MSKTTWKLHSAMIALLAVFLVGADEKPDTETKPDLQEHGVLGQEVEAREKVVAYLKKRSDDELKSDLENIFKETYFNSMSGYEPCLTEMLSRDGKKWQPYLKESFDKLMKREFKPFEDADFSFTGARYNLELLTALRRSQGKPDPLHIYIEGPKELEGIGSDLPSLKVAIKNVDVDKTSVGFTVGGNYRSGRQARWRIHLEDENGKAIPAREIIGIGGGLFSDRMLKHGESWKTSLYVRSFVEVPPPGKYKLTVLYHNTQAIAGRSNIDGLIVSRSNPITLTIKPFTIVHSKEDREAVRKFVADLNGEQKLKVIAGTYGQWAHKLISPDSPEGKLLSMGLKAVPTIVESLHDKKISKRKRAWLLSILYSLTSENDPRGMSEFEFEGSALGSYEYWQSGWQIWGGIDDEAPSGGLSPGGRGSRSGAEIDTEAQSKLVKAWDRWLKEAVVKEATAEDE